jgi:hypothetical protein
VNPPAGATPGGMFPGMNGVKLTPMFEQYLRVKSEYP